MKTCHAQWGPNAANMYLSDPITYYNQNQIRAAVLMSTQTDIMDTCVVIQFLCAKINKRKNEEYKNKYRFFLLREEKISQ